MDRVLVTGAAGFVGSNLVKQLLPLGVQVFGVDNLSRKGIQNNLKKISQEILIGDISNPDVFSEFPENIEVVFHLAATADKPVRDVDPIRDFETNARGTFNTLEFCRRVGAGIIYASSSKVYSEKLNETLSLVRKGKRVVPKDEKLQAIGPDLIPDLSPAPPIRSRSPYGVSKIVGEYYCHEYLASYEVPFVINRLGCIYGPNQFGTYQQGWFTWLVFAKLFNLEFTLFGEGTQVRDLLYVDDLVRLMISQAQNMNKINGKGAVLKIQFQSLKLLI